MIVTLLGSGTPIPSADRFGSAILVEACGLFLLFDCGRGATIRLHQAGVSPRQIDKVFFTHLHSDHVVGLPDLWLTGWILGRGEPLRIAGPDGTVEMARHLVQAYAADLQIRQHAAENLPAHGAGLDAEIVRSGVVHDDAGVRIRAFPVDHGHVTPAFGYRIEDGERVVVVSGDTRWSRSLIEASAGADCSFTRRGRQKQRMRHRGVSGPLPPRRTQGGSSRKSGPNWRSCITIWIKPESRTPSDRPTRGPSSSVAICWRSTSLVSNERRRDLHKN